MNENKTLEFIADFYGAEPQSRQLIEECAEVIQATNKVLRGKPNALDHLAEEIADVEIVIAQMKYLYGLKERVEDFKEQKIARELYRIEGESNERN